MSQSFPPDPGTQGNLIEGNVGGSETAEAVREEEAQSWAVVLEMIGDLPDGSGVSQLHTRSWHAGRSDRGQCGRPRDG